MANHESGLKRFDHIFALQFGQNSWCRVTVEHLGPGVFTRTLANCCLCFHHITVHLKSWLKCKCPAELASVTFRMRMRFLSLLLLAQLVNTESGSAASLHFPLLLREGAPRHAPGREDHFVYVITVLPHSKSACKAPLTIGLGSYQQRNIIRQNKRQSLVHSWAFKVKKTVLEVFLLRFNSQNLKFVQMLLDLQ